MKKIKGFNIITETGVTSFDEFKFDTPQYHTKFIFSTEKYSNPVHVHSPMNDTDALLKHLNSVKDILEQLELNINDNEY